MSEAQEIWTCSRCGCRQDISQLGFYAEIACTGCGSLAHVHNLLANYKIDSVLGIGGMSVVFKARDLVLGRPLAIKVLNDTYRDAPERIAGFENECSLMAKVRHENVVSVYSAGWARGQFYIAMELVKGRNLELPLG
jgi:serine/threonine protein kinase